MATLGERIDRGVLFLDKTITDWRQLINLETLDLGDPAHCVLGQVFSNSEIERPSAWQRGEQAVAEFEYDHQLLDDQDPDYSHVAYGFERDGSWEPYESLQAAWVQRILHG